MQDTCEYPHCICISLAYKFGVNAVFSIFSKLVVDFSLHFFQRAPRKAVEGEPSQDLGPVSTLVGGKIKEQAGPMERSGKDKDTI